MTTENHTTQAEQLDNAVQQAQAAATTPQTAPAPAPVPVYSPEDDGVQVQGMESVSQQGVGLHPGGGPAPEPKAYPENHPAPSDLPPATNEMAKQSEEVANGLTATTFAEAAARWPLYKSLNPWKATIWATLFKLGSFPGAALKQELLDKLPPGVGQAYIDKLQNELDRYLDQKIEDLGWEVHFDRPVDTEGPGGGSFRIRAIEHPMIYLECSWSEPIKEWVPTYPTIEVEDVYQAIRNLVSERQVARPDNWQLTSGRNVAESIVLGKPVMEVVESVLGDRTIAPEAPVKVIPVTCYEDAKEYFDAVLHQGNIWFYQQIQNTLSQALSAKYGNRDYFIELTVHGEHRELDGKEPDGVLTLKITLNEDRTIVLFSLVGPICV